MELTKATKSYKPTTVMKNNTTQGLALRKNEISTKESWLQEMNVEDVSPSPVTKALNEDLMQVTYVAMVPDAVDAHGDFTSAEDVRKAKESFNRAWLAGQKLSNLFHIYETETFSVIESYITPFEASVEGRFIAKSSWLVTLQIHDPQLWEMIKKNEIVGVSIGALATVEQLDKE